VAGLVTYYVLFFLHLETRRVSLAGITRHPTEEWMTQMARNAVDEDWGYLRRHRYVLHDRDTKFCADFRKTLATGGVKCLRHVGSWKLTARKLGVCCGHDDQPQTGN